MTFTDGKRHASTWSTKQSGGFSTPDLVEIYRHDWAYSSARAEAELGYRCRPLAEGLQATLAWLEETGQWKR